VCKNPGRSPGKACLRVQEMVKLTSDDIKESCDESVDIYGILAGN
jgi:hypothetical protein